MKVITINKKVYKAERDPFYQSAHWKLLKKAADQNLPTQCPMCKEEGVIKEGDVWDHIVQRKLGGKDELINLRKLCFHHDAVNRARQSNKSRVK